MLTVSYRVRRRPAATMDARARRKDFLWMKANVAGFLKRAHFYLSCSKGSFERYIIYIYGGTNWSTRKLDSLICFASFTTIVYLISIRRVR